MMFLPHERLRFTFQTFFSQNQFLLPEKCFSVVFRNVIVRGVVPSSFPQDHSTHFSCAQKKKSHSKPSELHGAFQCLHACQQPRVADAARRPGDPEGDRRRDDVFLHGHHASPRDGDGTSALTGGGRTLGTGRPVSDEQVDPPASLQWEVEAGGPCWNADASPGPSPAGALRSHQWELRLRSGLVVPRELHFSARWRGPLVWSPVARASWS